MRRLLVLALSVWATAVYAAIADHVTQYEITWTFDHAYTVGQFANGDWWVLGPVTITATTPAYRIFDFWDFTTAKTKGVVLHEINGWQVNPSTGQKQGFDGTLTDFDATLVPALPYTAQPGQSIVKAVSDTDAASPHRTHNSDVYGPVDSRMIGANLLKTAAVLTVLGTVPPDSGRTCFRPPYVGTDKPLYSTNNLRTDLLPSLAPVTKTPTIAEAAAMFQRVQLTHRICPAGQDLRAWQNMTSCYQPYNAISNSKGALRLLLNDPLAQKWPLLMVYVQYGIDIFHFIRNEPKWPGTGGGVEPGHKLPLIFAAMLLDDPAMKDTCSSPELFSRASGNDERTNITLGEHGLAIWGSTHGTDPEYSYWNYIINPPTYNGANSRDPYGYIDNSMTRYNMCDGYQVCCNSQGYKGEALTALLVPGMQAVWNQPEFFQYLDRWVNHGLLAQPDPCAPAEGTWSGGPNNGQRCTAAQDTTGDTPQCIVDAAKYRVTFGPDPANHGDCIRDTDPADGIGRFPNRDGKYADGGVVPTYSDHGYRSGFVDYMWTAYRATVPLAAPAMSPLGGTFSGVVDVAAAPAPSSWKPQIRYTTDGNDPTAASTLYTNPVRLRTSCTLKVRAFFGSYTPSAVVSAAFTITADTQGPAIASIITKQDSTKVTVVFSELVDSVTARQAANYTINKGISVLAASCAGNGPAVVLTTSAMQVETTYTLTVANIKDLSNNTAAAGTQKQFTFINFDPAVGLTGYWPFNTDAGTVAREVSGYSPGTPYNGTVTGAAWVPGRIGQGIQFTAAADKVALADALYSFNIDPTNAFTIAFWIKVRGHNGAQDDIISRRVPFTIQLTSTNRITTALWGGGSLTSSAALADSTWYHVAVTYKSGSHVLYLNGQAGQGATGGSTVDLYFPNTDATHFGSGLKGALDEVRFYDRALTAAQVAHLAADTTNYTTAVGDASARPADQNIRPVLSNPFRADQLFPYLRAHRELTVHDLSGRRLAEIGRPRPGVYILRNTRIQTVTKIAVIK